MSDALPPWAAYWSAVGSDRYKAGLASSPMGLRADWNVGSLDSLLVGFFVWASASLPMAPTTRSPWDRTATSPWAVCRENPLAFGVMGSPLWVLSVLPILTTARLEAAGSSEPSRAPAANEFGEPDTKPVASEIQESRSFWRLRPVWVRIWFSTRSRTWPCPEDRSCASDWRRLSPRPPRESASHESAGRSATGCGVSISFDAGASKAIESESAVTAAAAGPRLASCGLDFSDWISAAVCGSA